MSMKYPGKEIRRIQKLLLLPEVTTKYYCATKYNNIKEELTWLEGRALALKERRESVITGCSEI